MRAAQGKQDAGRHMQDEGLSDWARGGLSTEMDRPTGIGMPKPCWDRFGKQIRFIAKHCGVTVKQVDRYIDPLGVVYILFNRKEKDD